MTNSENWLARESFSLHSIGSPTRPLESDTDDDSIRFMISRLNRVDAIWSRIDSFISCSDERVRAHDLVLPRSWKMRCGLITDKTAKVYPYMPAKKLAVYYSYNLDYMHFNCTASMRVSMIVCVMLGTLYNDLVLSSYLRFSFELSPCLASIVSIFFSAFILSSVLVVLLKSIIA